VKSKISQNQVQKPIKSNTFKYHDDWNYSRWKLYLSKQINDKIYTEELALFKYHVAALYIMNNSCSKEFKNNMYPKTLNIKDLKVTLYFRVNMFQYCKLDHNFVIPKSLEQLTFLIIIYVVILFFHVLFILLFINL